MASEEQLKDELKHNPLIRREAGEGWHERGIDPALLKLIVEREVAVERLNQLSGADKQPSPELDDFLLKAQHVAYYKDENEISDPPPLPPEEN